MGCDQSRQRKNLLFSQNLKWFVYLIVLVLLAAFLAFFSACSDNKVTKGITEEIKIRDNYDQ